MADEAECGHFDVRAARRRLGNIMKKVGALLLELRELEAEIPVPPLREYEAMKARGECTFEAFFLGLAGMIDFELDEAVHGLWETYGQVNPSRFHGKFDKVPDFVSRQARRISARHGQSQCSTDEAMRRVLIELVQEGAESFPELAELMLCMVGKLVELGPDRQGVVNFVMAAVSKVLCRQPGALRAVSPASGRDPDGFVGERSYRRPAGNHFRRVTLDRVR
jgi:hypothetical protein